MLTDLNHTKRDFVNSTDLFILLTLISISTAIIILEILGGIDHGDMHILLGIIDTIAGDTMATTIIIVIKIIGLIHGIIHGTIGIMDGMETDMDITTHIIIRTMTITTIMEIIMVEILVTITTEKEVITIIPTMVTILEQDLEVHTKELMGDQSNKLVA